MHRKELKESLWITIYIVTASFWVNYFVGVSLDEALKLAVKVLSKTLDVQTLTAEKVEIAHLTRKDDQTVIHILTAEEVEQLIKEHKELEKAAEAEKAAAEKAKAAKKWLVIVF